MRLRLAILAIPALLLCHGASAQQVVFLDFDSGTDGSIAYTAQMRGDIQTLMEGHYSQFNVTFVQAAPGAGDFSTVTFNSGDAGGLASKIDFLNQDKNDTAVVNIDGLGLVSTADIVSASAIIGSHEFGHLLGCRHHDSWGPIGSGIGTGNAAGELFPSYPGPVAAGEFNDHIMASPASVGSSIADTITPSWFSERSAIKIANNEQVGAAGVQNEAGPITVLTLDILNVPNTIVSGQNAGETFDVEAFTAFGEISTAGDTDDYRFSGQAGEIWSFEVISGAVAGNVPGDVSESIDSTILVFDSSGTAVDYYGTSAFNDDELETTDSMIIDLILPADDTYTVRVGAFGASDIGQYYLYGYNLETVAAAVPAPATILLMLAGLIGFRRSRQR